ncbi:MAG: hypothetical protein K8R23_14700 [Chthoniobacter sp.]|nr:hypothetical protein [Chthoniobacter sp.]
MTRRILSLLLLLLLLASGIAGAAELPAFGSDQEADRWFRENSAFYRSMAKVVEAAGGYTIGSTVEWPGGDAYYKDNQGYIKLNDSLKGAHRFSILIFELTHLYQERHHRELTDRVRLGNWWMLASSDYCAR